MGAADAGADVAGPDAAAGGVATRPGDELGEALGAAADAIATGRSSARAAAPMGQDR